MKGNRKILALFVIILKIWLDTWQSVCYITNRTNSKVFTEKSKEELI